MLEQRGGSVSSWRRERNKGTERSDGEEGLEEGGMKRRGHGPKRGEESREWKKKKAMERKTGSGKKSHRWGNWGVAVRRAGQGSVQGSDWQY